MGLSKVFMKKTVSKYTSEWWRNSFNWAALYNFRCHCIMAVVECMPLFIVCSHWISCTHVSGDYM